MRVFFGVLALLALAACEPEFPNSGPGVGFSDYQSYEQERLARDRALETGQPLVPSGPNAPLTVIEGPVPVDPTVAGYTEGQSVAADTRALLVRPAGISDEQDFGAVSARQSIESDKQRLEAQRQQFQVVEPKAVPKRPSNLGANVAAFAVSTSHPIGTQVYSRSGTSASKAASACQKYSSPNGAQQAFLDAGGPDRDRLGVDPDGDGYACGWDPRPFR